MVNIFDCDEPPEIQAVIHAAEGYHLLLSNYLFETWLLMHFENVEEKISKRDIYRHLSAHLRNTYSKDHKGKTEKLFKMAI